MNKWKIEFIGRPGPVYIAQFSYDDNILGSIDMDEESREAFMKVWGDGSDRGIQSNTIISKLTGHKEQESRIDRSKYPFTNL